MVLPVGQDFEAYARYVVQQLISADFRAEADLRNEKVGYKIRAAEVSKVPYMLVVGRREMDDGTVAVRRHGAGQQEVEQLDRFMARLRDEVDEELTRRS